MKEIAKINQHIEVDDLQLTATVPEEMITAQKELLTWCEKKILSIQSEAQELGEAWAHAKKNKWSSGTLHRHHLIALKRVSYYEKLKAAVEAGYFIVPNFPITYFAVRTDKKKPVKMLTTDRWGGGDKEQLTQDQPLGIGEYKNPDPVIFSQKVDEEKKNFWAEDWREEIDFPMNMAKPVIMDVTSKAMALKIFDRFGVMPSLRKNDDPVIIGQIVMKTGRYSWQTKTISFMIAWMLDTRVL